MGRTLPVRPLRGKTRRRTAGIAAGLAHPVSRRLPDEAYTVAGENPKAKTMTASARGTVEEPGTGWGRAGEDEFRRGPAAGSC